MKKALLSLFLIVAALSTAVAQDKTQRVLMTDNVSACQSYTWAANGQTYTADTVVLYANATDDTMFVLSLVINQPYTNTTTVVSDNCTYTWRGVTYNEIGLFSDTVAADTLAGLCDSIFNLLLFVADTEYDTVGVQVCGSYTWNDSTYTASGFYFDTVEGTACTHIDVLDLSIVTSLAVTENVSHCGNYTWFDSTYTTDGVYTHTSSDTVVGCDTLHTLYLTIKIDTARREVDSACGSKTWRGTEYTTTGTYFVYDTNTANNCITYRSIDLNIKTPRNSGIDSTLEGCNTVAFTISSFTGTTTHRFTTDTIFESSIIDHRWNRCFDSLIHLNVTVHKSGYDTSVVNACDSFYWNLNEKTYYTTPTTAPNAAFAKDTFGCDSMMTLMLTIKPAPVITSIEGDWYIKPGESTVLYPVCTSGATYKWTYGTNTFNGDTLLIENASGNIDVTLEATINYPAQGFACHDTSWITVVTFEGIDQAQDVNVMLYPNPTVGPLNIESANEVVEAVVYNSVGQQVLQSRNMGSKSVMNLERLAKGSYTIRLALQNGEVVTRKFIITK
jgi:hypothetical protein